MGGPAQRDVLRGEPVTARGRKDIEDRSVHGLTMIEALALSRGYFAAR
jgi:hypothetical protein